MLNEPERAELERRLLANIFANLMELESLLAAVNEKWVYEDYVYRFYHQSYKVFDLQAHTKAIVDRLQSLVPDWEMNLAFLDIVEAGTGKVFCLEDNGRWLEVTRPILEAFFHARYFLEMICKYGKQLSEPPTMMPSGWAAVLYLFDLR
jgi:hypothetical protein